MTRDSLVNFLIVSLLVLPLAAQNRIEKAGTPLAFSALRVVNAPGSNPVNLHGTITLANGSDGLDPITDRVVFVLGTQVAVLEPGSVQPSGQSGKAWHFENSSAPLLTKLIFQKLGDLTWQFELGAVGPPTGKGRMYLRIGNDWGGVDLATGQALLTFDAAVDPAHSTQSPIGPAGGTLQLTDASGAIISLKVPAGALRQTVNISMTALAGSPEVLGAGAVTRGVQFQPEGLHFLIPATLTYDFHATTTALPPAPRLFLLTSPMTMVPLYGSADLVKRTLTASLFHFSNDQPATGSTSASDLTAWANTVLSGGTLTIEEMASLLAAVATQQQLGCTTGCIDLNQVIQAITTSVNATVAASCPADTANPTMTALQGYIQMDAFVQQVGGSVPALQTCEYGVLGALIAQAPTAVDDPPADLSNYITSNAQLIYATQLLTLTQQLGFTDLQAQTETLIDTILRNLAVKVVTAAKAQSNSAVTDEAKADLNQELQDGTEDHVTSVDPGFPAFIQQEIASLSGGMTVSVSGAINRTLAIANDFQIVVRPGLPNGADSLGCYWATLGGLISGFGNQQCSNLPQPGPDTAPPVSLSVQSADTKIAWTFSQPTPSTLAWDVTASTDGAQVSNGLARVGATLTFRSAGTLTIQLNTNWATAALGGTFNGGIFDENSRANVNLYHDFGPIPAGCAADPATPSTATVNIPGPGTWDLQFYYSVKKCLAGTPPDFQAVSGAGRLVTVTFGQ